MTILLVEDNPGDVRLIEEAFSETGIEVQFHVATDGEEALTFLRERREDESATYPDLLLLDLNLPRVDGFAVLDSIRDTPELRPLPILVLTSSSSPEDVVRCYDRGANAYLTKPDDPEAFVELARSVEAFWVRDVTLPSVPP